MLVRVLDAKLESGGDSGLQSRFEAIGKTAADVLRTDQVQIAWPTLARSECLGKILGDFVQGQAATFSVDAS